MATCALHNFIHLHNYEDDVDFYHIMDVKCTPQVESFVCNTSGEYTFFKNDYLESQGVYEMVALKEEIVDAIKYGT